MVDSLISYTASQAVSEFSIRKDNIFYLKGKLSASGIIENMAQTVALHTGYEYFLKSEKAPTGYLGSIKKIDIVSLPELNTLITTEITILHNFSGVTLVDIIVTDDKSQRIASGQMKTVIAK